MSSFNDLDDTNISIPTISSVKTHFQIDSIVELSQEIPSTITVSSAAMTNHIEYEKLDLGFLFEINFKLFLKEKHNHVSVLCINNKHQVIQSKPPAALLTEICEQLIIRRWVAVYYFCIRFFLDYILVHYLHITEPFLLSNLLTIVVIYELQVFYERIQKSQKYFTDLSSENRVYMKLKDFFGHDKFSYQHSFTIKRKVDSESDTLRNIEINAHNRFLATRTDMKVHKSYELDSTSYNHAYHMKQTSVAELAARSLGLANNNPNHSTPRNIAELPSYTSEKTGPGHSGVGGLFKGFRARKILPKAIIGTDEKQRLTQLALDAIQSDQQQPSITGNPPSPAAARNKMNNAHEPQNPKDMYNSEWGHSHSHSETNDNKLSIAGVYKKFGNSATSAASTISALTSQAPAKDASSGNSVHTATKTQTQIPADIHVVAAATTDDIQLITTPAISTKSTCTAQLSSTKTSEHNPTTTAVTAAAAAEVLKKKIDFPFTWNKEAFDSHIFNNFEFEDLEPAARDIFRDRSYAHAFKVRGPTYFIDQQKIDPGPAMMKLMLMELYEVEAKDGDRHDHIASRGLSKERVSVLHNLPGNPFIFVFNLQVAGDPPVSLVAYFTMPPDVFERYPGIDTENCLKLLKEYINIPFYNNEKDRLGIWGLSPSTDNCSDHDDRTFAASTTGGGWGFSGSDINWPDGNEPGTYPSTDFRNNRLKLVPLITEGPWVVRTAVPAKPVLLGKKLIARHFRGEGYFETDIHIGSSNVANQITGLCRGYAKHFAADLGIMLEPHSEDELPEKLLACIGINKIDIDLRRKLD